MPPATQRTFLLMGPRLTDTHKPGNIVDLDSWAIVAAEVRPGDCGDSEDLSTHIIEAAELVEDLHGQPPQEGR